MSAVNGQIIWSGWATWFGAAGIGLSWTPPGPGDTSVVVTIDCWVHATAGNSGRLHWIWYWGNYQSKGEVFRNYVVPGSGVVDVKVATYHMTVPVDYLNTTTAWGFAEAQEFNGSQPSAFTSTNWYVGPRPPYAPAAPSSATATRASDNQINLSWVNNSVSPSAVYDSLAVARWDSSTNVWTDIATGLSPTATSFSDTTTVANRRYQYRIRSNNVTGSAYGTTGTVDTTPAAISILSVAKTANNITLSWANNTTYQTDLYIECSDNGGAWTAIATLNSSYASWTHSGVSSTHTYQYRIRTGSAGLYSGYVTSAVVNTATAPNAPTVLTNLATMDAAVMALTVSWVHNPTDFTTQTGAVLQYRIVGAPTWTQLTFTTESSKTFAAGTLTNNKVYEFQIQTKGYAAAYGPFSSSILVNTNARPVPTITAPTATLGVAQLTATWTYYDAEGTAQSAWNCWITQAGTEISRISGTNAATSCTFPVLLANAATYVLHLTVADGAGMLSAEATRAFTTDFPLPPTPAVGTTWDPDEGTVEVVVTVPATGTGQADPVAIQVYRQDGTAWALVATNIPVSGTGTFVVIDPIPPLGQTELTYRAALLTASQAPAYGASTVSTNGSEWVFINGGAGFTTKARLKGNPAVELTTGRPKVLHTFAGRTKPLEFIGKARSKVYKLSGDVAGFPDREAELGAWAPFEVVSELPAPLCYRDPLGRRVFCSIGDDVSIKHNAKTSLAAISCTLTEVDYAQ